MTQAFLKLRYFAIRIDHINVFRIPFVHSGHVSSVLGNTGWRHRHGTDNRPKVIVTVYIIITESLFFSCRLILVKLSDVTPFDLNGLMDDSQIGPWVPIPRYYALLIFPQCKCVRSMSEIGNVEDNEGVKGDIWRSDNVNICMLLCWYNSRIIWLQTAPKSCDMLCQLSLMCVVYVSSVIVH